MAEKFRMYMEYAYLAGFEQEFASDFLGDYWYVMGDWGLREARPGEQTINESFQIFQMDTKANIRADAALLSLFLEQTNESHNDPATATWTWFEHASDGESDKRALIYPGAWLDFKGRKRDGYGPFLRTQVGAPVINFARHRYWENDTATSISSEGPHSLIGTKISLTGDGTADGRAAVTRFVYDGTSTSIGGTTLLNRWWIGMRPAYQGTTGFEPVWDLYDGTLFSTEATKQTSITNAYNSQVVRMRHTALNTPLYPVRMSISQARTAGNAVDFIGRYLVLLRWSASSGAEFAVSLGQSMRGLGVSTPYGLRNLPPQYLSGTGLTTFDMTPLGIIDIPMTGNKSGWTTALDVSILSLQTEMLSGTISSDDLYLDTLTLIPADRIITSESADWPGEFWGPTRVGDDEYQLTIRCRPDDSFVGYSEFYDPGGSPERTPILPIDINPQNFVTPRTNGLLVFAAARADSSVLADAVDRVEMEIYHRWRSYRD